MSETHASAPSVSPPVGNPRFPLFDSLRAIAALSVLLDHTVTMTYSFASAPRLLLIAAQVGNQGVAVFFLISGFLLYRPFLTARRERRRVSLLDYARRRVLRIVPAYWVALTLLVAAGLVTGVTSGNWWIFYGFGQNYSVSTLGHGIGVAWTLCIEATFYIALPLFAVVAQRLGRRLNSLRGDLALLVALGAGSLIFRAQFNAFLDVSTISTLPGFFFWFALGMGLAVASVTAGAQVAFSRLSASVRVWPTLSWALAGLLFLLVHESHRASSTLGPALDDVAGHLLYGLVAFFLLLPAVFDDQGGGPVRAVLRLPALVWLGLISYALYLYHATVIEQLDNLLGEHGPSPLYVVLLIGSIVISVACAAASFYLVERPLMRLRPGGRRPLGSGHELARAEDPPSMEHEPAG